MPPHWPLRRCCACDIALVSSSSSTKNLRTEATGIDLLARPRSIIAATAVQTISPIWTARRRALCTTMLASMPLAFSLRLDASAVDQQFQGAMRAPVGNCHRRGLLPTVQCAEIRNRSIEANERQAALPEPARHLARTLCGCIWTAPDSKSVWLWIEGRDY